MIAAIIARGDGATAAATATGALEAAAGFVQRAFASAEVEAPDMIARALTPACLGMIGRALIRSGELLYLIETDGGELRLWPCESWDVTGNYRDWRYRLTCGGPSRTRTFASVEAAGVLHFKYAVDPSRPWRGLSPPQVASLAGKLSAETSAALSDEASGPRGAFLPVPADGEDPAVTAFKGDVRGAQEKMLVVESGDWGDAGNAATQYQPRRFGADPPDAVISQAKLETGVKLDWRELRAGDISGRARAFQSLVGGGMAVDDAAALSGLLTPDE